MKFLLETIDFNSFLSQQFYNRTVSWFAHLPKSAFLRFPGRKPLNTPGIPPLANLPGKSHDAVII